MKKFAALAALGLALGLAGCFPQSARVQVVRVEHGRRSVSCAALGCAGSPPDESGACLVGLVVVDGICARP